MAEDNGKVREMAEIEGLISRYIHKYVNPEVVSRYHYVLEQHEKENPESSAPIIGSVYGSAGLQSRDMSKWKPADTAGILDYVAEKIGKDKAMSLDMVNLVEAWKAAYIKHYGEDRYNEISKNVEFGDLATYYVNTRMRQIMLERLAKEKAPKSSLEYVAVAAAQSSLFGTMLTALTDEEKQKEFEMVRRLYNPSAGEKAAAEASAFAIDVLSLGPLGGLGSGAGFTGKLAAKGSYSIYSHKLAGRYGTEFAEKMFAKGLKTEKWLLKNMGRTEFLGFELFSRSNDIIRHSGGEDNKELSKLLYGDENTCDRILSSKEGKALDSDICDAVNGCLNRKVLTLVKQDNIRRTSQIVVNAADGSGSAVLDEVRNTLNGKGLAYLPQKKVPEWMIRKCSEETCIKNAAFYLGIAQEMSDKGRRTMKVGNREMTLKEVTQQAYDYARAADRKHQESGLNEMERLIQNVEAGDAELRGMGLTDGYQQDVTDSHILQHIRASLHKNGLAYVPEREWPEWMNSMSQDKLEYEAKRWRNLAVQMQNQKKTEQVFKGAGTMTLQEVSQRAYDYARAADVQFKAARDEKLNTRQMEDEWDRNMEAINASMEQPVEQPQVNASYIHPAVDVQYSEAQQTAFRQAYEQRYAQAYVPVSGQNAQAQMTPQASKGWKGLLDNLGLGGMSDLSQNLGYTIASLPQMIAGMFTGKLKGFTMKDNMIPLGLLMMALLFGKRMNPLLKFMMLGLGGAMLLNNANKALTGQTGEQQSQKTYRRYDEEELSPRLKNPVIKGNTIDVEIDGVPTILTIKSPRLIDAYNKGAVPPNALCNAVLRAYDANGQAVSQNYERGLAQQQEEDMQNQIKIR